MSEQEIFIEAMNRKDPAERRRFLKDACGNDRVLRERLEKLIRHSENVGSFLENPPRSSAVTAELPSASEGPGTEIGPYKIVEKLGEGGMGAVYMAEQKTPVRRVVALKVIKRGMDTEQVVARFEAERQALALMNHPNIARVLEAGATDDGRPYFVMELVRGVPITDYGDEHRLTRLDRLKLFVTVCEAMQHAHQKGIIHRDLKPSNILVELHDVAHVPKVIDFGVAKATGQRLTERTLVTRFSQMIGTPLYMSPEQAELSGLDVDTRSDIYSLGVLLYELLTGTAPFEFERFRSASLDEMRRIIREDDPLRPSRRIDTLDAKNLSTLAERQQVDVKRLRHGVERELDWIVMKALEKDRARRYESASALAQDVQRYLNDEPVIACPPSSSYRFQKFARRNKTALLTAIAVAVALVLGILATSSQAIRATRAERAAREEFARAEEAAAAAQTEAAIAKAVNDFINSDLLAQGDPRNESHREVSLRVVVDRAAKLVGGRFQDLPLVEAAVRHTLGETYLGLGRYQQAAEQYQHAVAIRRTHLGEERHDTLATKLGLARAAIGQRRFNEAEGPIREVLAIQERTLGKEHPDTLTSRYHLAVAIARGAGKGDDRKREAETLHREVLDVRRRVLGPEHEGTLASMEGLANSISSQGRYSEAEQLNRELLSTQQGLFEEGHPRLLSTTHNLAVAIFNEGRHAEAEKIHRGLLATMRRLGAEEEPFTIMVMRIVAMGYARGTPEAGDLYREVLEIRQKTLGNEHRDTIFSMHELAEWHFNQGQLDAAATLYRDALELQHRAFGAESSRTVRTMEILAIVLARQERHIEAAELFRKVLDSRRRALGEEHIDTARALEMLVRSLATDPDPSRRNPEEAVELAQIATELKPDNANNWSNLGVSLYRAGQWQAAVESLEKADKMVSGGDQRHRMFLAMAYWQLGDRERARQLYAEGLEWIVTHRKNRADYQRFRAEAAQLLGIEPQPDAGTDEEEGPQRDEPAVIR